MKKFTKIAACGLLAALGLTTLASCGDNGLAKEVISKVILTQDGEKISEDFTIPKIVKHNDVTYNVSWVSSDTSVLDIVENNETVYTADVKRPFDANAEVKLTATVEAKGKKASEEFKATIVKIDFEQAAVSKLGIGAAYNREDISEAVVVNLPTSTADFKDVINYSYEIDGTPATVKLEDNKLTIDPTSGTKEVVDLKVTATSSVTKEIVVKVNVNQVTYTTIEEYDAAAADAEVTVKGIIVAREPYAESYKNTTLYLQDISGKGGYDAYRIKCESVEAYNNDLAIGNVILVSGKKALYNGLREFAAGCTYEVASKGKAYKDTDVTDMIKTDVSKVSLDLQCQLIHFSSLPVVAVGKEDTKGRWNITVGDEKDSSKQFVVRIDTGLLPIDTDAYKAIKELNISVGDIISAKGVAGWSNKAQLFPLAADSIVVEGKTEPVTPPTPPVEEDSFAGVVTAVGFKDVKDNKMRCYILVQNANSQAKFVYIEAPIDATNTAEAAKAAINAKFVVGKSVTIKGTTSEYNGLNQYVVAWDKLATDVTLGDAGTTPEALDITAKVGKTDELKALQGVLVKVTGTYNADGTLVTDGGKILLYFEGGFLATNPLSALKVGGKYTVSGYLNWYNQPQISPISADAVTVVDESTIGQRVPEATVTGTTIVSGDLGLKNATPVTFIQFTDGSVSFDKASGANAPTYYNTGTAIRLYKGNVMTFTSTKKIVKIEFVTGTNTETKLGEGNTTVNVGTMDWETLTWTGEATEVVFTVDSSTSDKPRIEKIIVTYAD
ncbi:MAG: hypothetical protein K2J85_02810 [Anaeroplasmataceae bacterium]|nr:hypothetical protein [Anaeroplasmataceae bacterium]